MLVKFYNHNINNADTISKKIGISNDIETPTNDESSKLLQFSDVSFIQKIGARTESLLESMFHRYLSEHALKQKKECCFIMKIVV